MILFKLSLRQTLKEVQRVQATDTRAISISLLTAVLKNNTS